MLQPNPQDFGARQQQGAQAGAAGPASAHSFAGTAPVWPTGGQATAMPGMQSAPYPMGTAGFPGAMPTAGVPTPSGAVIPGAVPAYPAGTPVFEESYIENILRLNLGKMATVYMTFENNSEWNAKIFRGRLEAAGRDHIIISDPQTGTRYLLLMVNLDYITFEEPLNYYYPFAQTTPGR